MIDPRPRLVLSLDIEIERALQDLTNLIADARIPADTRRQCALAHAALHRCRSPETVARMEASQGLRRR